MTKSIGLIVNPIAGMGGKVGLKGTDGAATLERARALGAVPLANERSVVALAALASTSAGVKVHAFAGQMGEDAALAAGMRPHVVGHARAGESNAGDTAAAARKMADLGVDLILFAGGDGTARDIYETVGQGVPILGIPTGVKMHSAVFATGPASAGRLAGDYVLGGSGRRAARCRDHGHRRGRTTPQPSVGAPVRLCPGSLSPPEGAARQGHERMPWRRNWMP